MWGARIEGTLNNIGSLPEPVSEGLKMKTIQPFPALRAICGLIMLVTTAQVAAQDKPSQQKLKVEDVISRHIASIGPPEVLAETKSRLISGTTSAISRGQGVSTISGKMTFASTGNKNLL